MTVYPTPKINVGLNIVSKRPDGFHNIETLFYPYTGVSDILSIEPSETFSIEIENCNWDPQKDLCAKAWRLMRERYGIGPVNIRLTKRIPVGAGMGGGSADAAATVKVLSEIFALGLPDAEMVSICAVLGSDCPFFIYNRPCLACGRGEVLTGIDIDLSAYAIRVEFPCGETVSTAEAYGGLTPRPLGEPLGKCSEAFVKALERPVSEWQGLIVNDFEESVFRAHPAIEEAKKRLLREGALYASMTGSGAAVYGIFSSR